MNNIHIELIETASTSCRNKIVLMMSFSHVPLIMVLGANPFNEFRGKNKLIVYTKGRVPDAQMSENATPGDLLNKAPIVILINSTIVSGIAHI